VSVRSWRRSKIGTGRFFVLHAFPFGARVVYDDEFESTPGIDRASIFLAGPVANVLCAMFMSTMFLVTHDHIVVDDGASVERVITNGAASKAGVLEGDIIQSVNGISIVADEASYATRRDRDDERARDRVRRLPEW